MGNRASSCAIDGRPYFSIYDPTQFIAIFGGVEATAQAISDFREKVRAAGFPGLNLNAVVWGQTILPGERPVDDVTEQRGHRILNINCWNEWTEGSYLEPDTTNGMAYLEAIREVFGTGVTRPVLPPDAPGGAAPRAPPTPGRR